MVSRRIKELRKSLDLTQSDFGRRLGVSRDVIANIEYDRVEPRHLLVEHLCSVFNANMDWILEGTGEMFNTISIDNKSMQQATELFSNLNPKLQGYALAQIKELLEVQENIEV